MVKKTKKNKRKSAVRKGSPVSWLPEEPESMQEINPGPVEELSPIPSPEELPSSQRRRFEFLKSSEKRLEELREVAAMEIPPGLKRNMAIEAMEKAIAEHLQQILQKPINIKMLEELERTAGLARKILIVARNFND